MRDRRAPVGVAAAVLTLVLGAGCGQQISDKYVIEDEPATLTDIAGSDLKIVTLTEDASVRLGIETTLVSATGSALVVPSGALWMDIEGVFWVYTNPEPLVFRRHAVDVVDDDGQIATLSTGPAADTRVVTVGVPELFGAEVGVGK